MNITFKDIPRFMQIQAINAVNNFIADYPDCVGVRNFVIYGNASNPNPVYVYRTKAGNIVVRMA